VYSLPDETENQEGKQTINILRKKIVRQVRRNWINHIP